MSYVFTNVKRLIAAQSNIGIPNTSPSVSPLECELRTRVKTYRAIVQNNLM